MTWKRLDTLLPTLFHMSLLVNYWIDILTYLFFLFEFHKGLSVRLFYRYFHSDGIKTVKRLARNCDEPQTVNS